MNKPVKKHFLQPLNDSRGVVAAMTAIFWWCCSRAEPQPSILVMRLSRETNCRTYRTLRLWLATVHLPLSIRA